ncbi:PilT protein domain protein (plasmid) [Rhizobium grahamii CCGE 502]|uniref:PilT protein domain protein n=1 Tax=Rhizobium grahamii CCGE 502 TaxID=990285 RepID=S3H5L3_9HYPH|nr:PilT protein domain protein [Rhizobium grahamii CCGE 502]
MAFVIDASLAAAWLLPEEYSEAAETIIAAITAPCPVPSLFFFEIRNILAMAERRGRIGAGGALVGMERARRLPAGRQPYAQRLRCCLSGPRRQS